MRDIARQMDMEAASLYNHISGKQKILSELLMEIAYLFTEGMKEVQNSGVEPVEKLEALISLHVDITVAHTDAISLLPNEWVHLQEPSLKEFLELRNDYDKAFKSIVTSCIKNGNFKQMDIDLAVFSILSTLRWLYSWLSKYKDKDVDMLKRELTEILIEGLKT